MYKIKKHQQKTNRIILLCISIAAIITVISYCTVRYLNENSNNKNDDGQYSINYDPPTQQEITETENQKDKIAPNTGPTKDQPNTTPPSNSPVAVVPVISSWGYSDQNLEISGFVPGIIESAGTCTVKAVNGTLTATASSSGTPNAQNVSCGLIKIPRSKLNAGTWTITIDYKSTKHNGTSEPRSQDVN